MNFGTPVPLIIGVILIVGAIALFFLDKIKPGCRRDSDNVYAFLSLLAGVILLAHLGMEFTLSLQQMIVVGMLVALMIENIQSRIPGGRPSRPSGNRGAYDDDYRPRRSQRSSMRAEAQLEFDEDRIPSSPRPRRIRGEGDRRSSRDDYRQRDRGYEDESQSYSRGSRRSPDRSYETYGQDGYRSEGYSRYEGYDADLNRPAPSNPNVVEERPRRRRPLQLKGEMADQTYTPDDYSSAVKALRNRRRTSADNRDDYSTGGDSSSADTPDNGYGDQGNGDDYVDYKPLDLPKYPGPKPGSGGSDGSY